MVSKETIEETLTAPTEDSKLNKYELLLIISPELSDEELEANLNKVGSLISEQGGEISATDQWGKRKLAYPIKNFSEGVYVLLTLGMEPTACQQIEASLRISEDILRYMLINTGS